MENQSAQHLEIEIRSIEKPRHLSEAVRDAFSDQADLIVACGGDGLFHYLINEIENGEGLANSPDLAVLPFGTANDFFKNFRDSPFELPETALQKLLNSAASNSHQSYRVDAGRAKFGMKSLLFHNALCGGIGAQITAETPEYLKKIAGGTAYTLNAMGMLATESKLTSNVAVEIDDEKWEGESLFWAINNSRWAGGKMINSEASPSDGKLDITLVKSAEPDLFPKLLQKIFEEENSIDDPLLIRQQASKIRICSDNEFPFNLDGEPHRMHELEVTIEKGMIPVCLKPADY